MTIVASMCPVMESAGPTRPGDSDATMLRFDQYRDSGARVLNGFILEPELFRMPANSLQALFKFLQLVRRDFSEDSSNISCVLPKDRDDKLLATRRERDNTDAPVFGAFDTAHEPLAVETVNRDTDRPRSEVHLWSDRLRRVIAPTFRPRSTSCCFPWLRITPRRRFRTHASSTNGRERKQSFVKPAMNSS